MTQQLLALQGASAADPPTYNPRPAGVIQQGSATEAVLLFLQANPDRSYWHRAIQQATGRTAKSVDWALLYLRALDLVEALPDERNARYLRYRVRLD